MVILHSLHSLYSFTSFSSFTSFTSASSGRLSSIFCHDLQNFPTSSLRPEHEEQYAGLREKSLNSVDLAWGTFSKSCLGAFLKLCLFPLLSDILTRTTCTSRWTDFEQRLHWDWKMRASEQQHWSACCNHLAWSA